MAITATYVSASSFTVNGDLTADFSVGVRVKADCGADGTKYGTVSNSVYTSLTTVTVTLDSGSLTSNLVGVYHSNDRPISLVNHGHTGATDGGLIVSGATKWTTSLAAATDYTATPASTSTITMLTDQTGNIKTGTALRYTIGGTAYYGICTAITSGLLTVAGAPLSGSVTALAYSIFPGMVEAVQIMLPGYWADSADTSLILNDLVSPWVWAKPPAALVQIKAYSRVTDTGGTYPRINARIGSTTTDYVSTSNSNAGLSVAASATWYSTVVDIDAAKYAVTAGQTVELKTDANGGNDNAADLTVILVFVYA